jgi:hypothetical protein
MPTPLTAASMRASDEADCASYCNCMEEIRCRIKVIQSVGEHSTATKYLAFDQELVFLQFRMILEIIAFSSLIANKASYSAAHANFEQHWKANRMLEALEKVNPQFYPVALGSPEQRGGTKHFPPSTALCLTKDDFIFLYDKCGSMLHSRNPFTKEDSTIPLRYSVKDWVLRIQNLLSLHVVHLVNGDVWVVFVPEEGRIQATIADSLSQP